MNNVKDIFKPNQNIEIEIKHGSYKGIYHSRIEETGETCMEIAIPSHQGHLLPLPAQSVLECRLSLQSSLFVFKARIVNVLLQQQVPVWQLEYPIEVAKVQRRNFVRVELRLPTVLKIVDDEQSVKIEGKTYTPKEFNNKSWEVSTKDLSGSGAKLISKISLPENLKISLEINLPEIGRFFTIASVVRSELVNPELGIYWIGVHFLGLSEAERDKVIRFIFRKQIELRKRSLL